MSYWETLASRAYPGDWAMKAKGQGMDDDRRRREIRTQVSSKWAEIENLRMGRPTAESEAKQDTLRREIRALEAQMYR